MIKIKLERDTNASAVRDCLGDFRAEFKISVETKEQRDAYLSFVDAFSDAVKDDNVCWTSGLFLVLPERLHIKVGYAQKFENEFNAEFN